MRLRSTLRWSMYVDYTAEMHDTAGKHSYLAPPFHCAKLDKQTPQQLMPNTIHGATTYQPQRDYASGETPPAKKVPAGE